jgi:hypothetical protein
MDGWMNGSCQCLYILLSCYSKDSFCFRVLQREDEVSRNVMRSFVASDGHSSLTYEVCLSYYDIMLAQK